MVTYSMQADSLEEIAEALEERGHSPRIDEEWQDVLDELQVTLEATATATRETDGRGRQQSFIAELAGFGRQASEKTGSMLDLLVAHDMVERDDRRYRVTGIGKRVLERTSGTP